MGIDRKLTENLKLMMTHSPDVDVVKDMPYKHGYMANSFFAIGHAEAQGHLLNYLFHIMSYVIPGMEPEMTYCFSVTDESTGEYQQWSHAYPFPEVEFSAEEFLVKTPKGSMSGTLDKLLMKADIGTAAIDLELEAIGYPLYNGGTGKFRMVETDIYEYSIPNLRTNGTISINGKTYTIENGHSWYDRQWQLKLPPIPNSVMKGAMKVVSVFQGDGAAFTLPIWGWMDINLEDGDKISTWFAVEKNGENCWATVMHPDGCQKIVRLEPVIATATDYWKSKASGASYPMTYKIKIPELDTDLTVRCAVEDQELYFPENAMYNHYEGASTVEGVYHGKETKGYCYVELIGDWSKQ